MDTNQDLGHLKSAITNLAGEISSKIEYSYPITDEKTDENLDSQDLGMREREKTLYARFLKEKSGFLVDFGCGQGANFKCFDNPENAGSLLLGVEPDQGRYRVALEHAKKFKNIDVLVANSNISLLQNLSETFKADAILCSQVLGHVSHVALKKILATFEDILSPGGYCLISVPVAGEQFSLDPSAHGWQQGEDYLHLINFDASPFESDYRARVTLDEFNQATNQPIAKFLPVRCYWLEDFPRDANPRFPIPMAQLPATFDELVKPGFETVYAAIYSIHELVSGVSGVGDILMVLRRR